MKDIISYFKSLSPGHRSLISEVDTLMKLILVMPATNATSERMLSALRRVKTYLRTTMSQNRLNHLMLLHVHKEMTDSLKDPSKMIEMATMFVDGSEHRKSIFGVFTTQDLATNPALHKTKATQTMGQE